MTAAKLAEFLGSVEAEEVLLNSVSMRRKWRRRVGPPVLCYLVRNRRPALRANAAESAGLWGDVSYVSLSFVPPSNRP